MKAVVTLAVKDSVGEMTHRTYHHVHECGVMTGGMYVLSNVNGNPIAHIPLGMIVDVVFPDEDTNIDLVQGRVKLA